MIRHNVFFNDFYDSDRSVSGSKSPQQWQDQPKVSEISNEWLSGVLNTKVLSHKATAAAMGQTMCDLYCYGDQI